MHQLSTTLFGHKRPFLLILLLLLILAACNSEEPTPTPEPTEEVAAAPTEEPTDEPTAVPTETPSPEPTETAVPEPTATPEPEPAYEPIFETAACEFDAPAGRDVSCGYLIVPEDRDNPDPDDTVRLHVAIFASESSDPAPDPVIYLDGGPGGDALETVFFAFEDNFSPFLADRDFIMFDQRGTGFSEPSLACPESTEASLAVIDQILSEEESNELEFESLTACRERLLAEGANLTEYNSINSAADLNDLRLALGYDEWNLYGISYGSKLALTTMRDFPDGIRSVILDSVYPLQVSLLTDLPPNVNRAFDVFFAGCAADPVCNEAYPDLETTFFDTVDGLNAEPITISITNFLSGERYDAAVDGRSLISVLFQSLYSAEIIPLLPQMITETAAGDTQLLGLLLSNTITNQDFISVGVNVTVQCHEEIIFDSVADAEAAFTQYPELAGFLGDPGPDFELCAVWEAGTAQETENEPVRSDIPTLVISGEYDPITPPSWGDLAAETLPNSFVYTFPGVGHGASVSDECATAVALDFLNAPTTQPDDGCIAEMGGPAFVVAGDALEVELEPVTAELPTGSVIDTVAPVDWEEQLPGTYLRAATGLDQTAIVQQVIPGAPENAVLELLTGQLGLDGDAEELARYEDANGRSWGRYGGTLQDLPVDIAITEDGSNTYLVLMITTAAERDGLVAGLLLPVLDAIQVVE